MTVVIEVASPAPTELVGAMVDACSSAVIAGRCGTMPVGIAAQGASGDAGRAAIGWSADGSEVSLDITVDGASSHRALHFEPQDPLVERWRSVGLVVGTVAGEAERRRADGRSSARVEPLVKPPPRAQPAIPRPATRAPTREQLVIDAGVSVGNGLDDGGLRIGALVRLEGLVPHVPIVLAADFAFSDRPPDASGVSARWIHLVGSVGLRGAFLERALAFEGRIGGVAEWTGAAVDGDSGSDAGGRWQPGIGVGVELAWMFSRFVGLAGGIDGAIVPSGTAIRVEKTIAGRSPSEHVAGYVGVRLPLF